MSLRTFRVPTYLRMGALFSIVVAAGILAFLLLPARGPTAAPLLSCPDNLQASATLQLVEGAERSTREEAAELGLQGSGFSGLILRPGSDDDFVGVDDTGEVMVLISIVEVPDGFIPDEIRSCGFPPVEGVPFIQDQE